MASYNIDIRRLVSFGLVNNLIRRLQVFPVSTKAGGSLTLSSSGSEQTAIISSTVPQLVDGKHHMDEIAVQFGAPYSELREHFDKVVYR
jgi:hypothetical protein